MTPHRTRREQPHDDLRNPPSVAETVEQALETHRARTEAVLASGDPAAIKGLYVELGDLLERAVGEHIEAAPLLSLPETEPVVLRLLDGVRGRVLDAGCGPNPAISVALGREAGRSVVGIDIGFGIVRVARAVAVRAGVSFDGVVADLEALPFRTGVFDAGVCDDTIEHLPDDARGVTELARVLAPSGRMVIATPNRHSADVLYRKMRDRLGGRRAPAASYYRASSHLREYGWGQFERLVKPAFRITRRAPVGWEGGGWKRRVASRVASRRPFLRLSRMIVVEVARRA
jgi:SAM-dependent methyltransferase